MNGFARVFSVTAPGHAVRVGFVALAAALLGAGLASAAPVPPKGPAILAPDIVAASKQPRAIPSLSAFPEPSKDMKTAAQWRALVVETRQAGAYLTRRASQEPWTLNDTDAWARAARVEATPPPSAESPGEGDTEAFVKAMRARATPPPRHR